MALPTIDWLTKIISVPTSYLTQVQVFPIPIYDMPINQFRIDVMDLLSSEDGMPFLDAYIHKGETDLGGVTYARIIDMINNYTVTFEDGQYAVNLTGANSDIGDVVNVNQVSVRSQNSAGLISNQAIEYSSFNGGVTIDVVNGDDSSTAFPAGTPLKPVKTLSQVSSIASYRGFTKVFLIGNLTIPNGVNWYGFEFVGESVLKTRITIDTDAAVLNCEFYDVTITGVLDGNSQIERSVIDNLEFVDGYIFNCAITGLKLGNTIQANIFTSFSTVAGSFTPTIDMNATGTLALRDYNGGVLLTNYSGTGSHSIDLSSGQIKLSNTITSGTFVVRGVGKLIDESGNAIESGLWNSGVTIINELISNKAMAKEVLDTDLSNHTEDGTLGGDVQDIKSTVDNISSGVSISEAPTIQLPKPYGSTPGS